MRIEYEGLAVSAVTIHTAPSRITKIHGFKVAANDRFLQLHDTKATPAAAAVPLRVWPIYGTAPFGEGFIQDGIQLQYGCTFVVSTTANTYTASAETVDLFVNGASVWDNTGVSSVGDYTTGTPSLDGWANGDGPKELIRLEFTALTSAGAVLYAKLFAIEGASLLGGEMPLLQISLPDDTSIDSFFRGYFPLAIYLGLASSLPVQGLSVFIDDTPGPLVGTYAGTDYAIKITYK